MQNLLAIHTAGDVCSVAFLIPAKERAELVRSSSEPRSHARLLAQMCSELIEEAAHKPSRIVVAAGPGSYTGLRIGVSTAKGLAWSMDVPLYAVSTLECLAEAYVQRAGKKNVRQVISVMRSRDDEVFASVFEARDARLNRTLVDQAVTTAELRSRIGSQVDSRVIVSDRQSTLDEVSAVLDCDECALIGHDARHLGLVLQNQTRQYLVEDLHSFVPYYLKEFVARKASKSIFDRLPFS